MSELLLLTERIQNTISLGESHFREFKTALEGLSGAKKARSPKLICREIAEALVAFANADGGELLIGVEDDGSVTGMAHDERAITEMLAAPRTHVHSETQLPLLFAQGVQLGQHRVLFFSVAKGTTEIYQLPDGRCIRRKDRDTLPVTFARIQVERGEIRSREYDREFVDGAAIADLDLALLRSLAESYLHGLSVERYLQQSGLAEYAQNGLRLRRAALLLFATDIARWHPRSEVRILSVAGTTVGAGETYNVTSDQTVRGNIFELLTTAWEALRAHLVVKTALDIEARFEPHYRYPEGACREALVNALTHRDYSIQNGVEVYLYTDRLEVRSPGPLLSTLTVTDLEALQGAHESRNVYIARVLRENNYVRELGEGVRRIVELTQAHTLRKPGFYSNRTAFSVTLPQNRARVA
jgi:ATP-dependent DNA helicase RecG